MPGSARWARGRPRSTPCATPRRSWSATACRWRRWTCPRRSAAPTRSPPTTPPSPEKRRRDRRLRERWQASPRSSLDRMARLGVVIDRWTAAKRLDATAIQCWTAMEEHFGTFPCTLMSMMSNKLMPVGVRNGRRRRARHVRARACLGPAGRADRLEQQLRGRGATRPSSSTARTCPRRSSPTSPS